MSELYLRDTDDDSTERVTSQHPLPVKGIDVRVGVVHGPIATAQLATTTTAQLLLKNPLAGRVSVTLFNTDATDSVFIGGTSTVSATNGFRLKPGATTVLPIGPEVPVWVIASANTPNLDIMELSDATP
jgi:hypothetical protein